MVNFAKSLDGDPKQIEAVYNIAEERSIFVKYSSEEAMLHALSFNLEDLVFQYANGKKANVRLSHASELIQYVRVFDLPPEVPDREIATVLGKYGTVKRVIREKFPSELCFDAYTGVRGAYVDVKKEIPTSLHFLNRRGNISYLGNKERCFVCKANGHQMNPCPKRKVQKQQSEEQSGSKTYASVVDGTSSSQNENQQKEMQLKETQLESTQPEKMEREDMSSNQEEMSEDGISEDEINEGEISEDEPSYKDNVFYKIALKIKEKQDEERERKRLQDRKDSSKREKAKAKKKSMHK